MSKNQFAKCTKFNAIVCATLPIDRCSPVWYNEYRKLRKEENKMFFDFDLAVSLEFEYDNYVEECAKNGTTPLSFQEWWDSYE